MQEDYPQQNRERIHDLQSCTTVDDLLAAVRQRGFIQGSRARYSADDIARQINAVLEAKRDGDLQKAEQELAKITGTEDLFNVVDRVTDNQLETKELHPSLARFERFVATKKREIEALHATGNGKEYADIFYDLFYSQDFEDPHHGLSLEELDAQITTYNEQVRKAARELHELQGQGARILDKENGTWFQYRVNYAADSSREPEGRFYFHMQPEMTPGLFKIFVEYGAKHGMRFEAKIDNDATVKTLTRPETMVVYFPTTDHDKLLAFVQHFHRAYEKYFRGHTPEFTAPVTDHAQTLKGIAYGDEPSFQQSFGEVRTQILEQLYKDAQNEGMEVTDPRFHLGLRFRAACVKFRVDPREPAFNLASS